MMERYICLFYTRQWLFIRFHLFQSHSILAHPPAPVYSFIFTPDLCRSDMGVFLSARDQNMPVQASIWWWPWRLDSPITTTSFVCPHVCVCDVCVFYEYASTNGRPMYHSRDPPSISPGPWRSIGHPQSPHFVAQKYKLSIETGVQTHLPDSVAGSGPTRSVLGWREHREILYQRDPQPKLHCSYAALGPWSPRNTLL